MVRLSKNYSTISPIGKLVAYLSYPVRILWVIARMFESKHAPSCLACVASVNGEGVGGTRNKGVGEREIRGWGEREIRGWGEMGDLGRRKKTPTIKTASFKFPSTDFQVIQFRELQCCQCSHQLEIGTSFFARITSRRNFGRQWNV